MGNILDFVKKFKEALDEPLVEESFGGGVPLETLNEWLEMARNKQVMVVAEPEILVKILEEMVYIRNSGVPIVFFQPDDLLEVGVEPFEHVDDLERIGEKMRESMSGETYFDLLRDVVDEAGWL